VLVRNPSRASHLLALGCELVSGDLHDARALVQLLEATQAVVHCAGAVRGRDYAEFARTNVQGTAQLLAALPVQNAPVLLMLSSLAAREPQLSWYSRSKSEAEQLLYKAPDSLAWSILRPPAVYGPGDRELLPLFRLASRGWMPVPGDVMARVSLIHVSDLVSAVLALLAEPRLRGAILSACDGKTGGYSWRDIAATAEQVWARPVKIRRLPAALLDAVAAANLWRARAFGPSPMLTPAKLRELRHPDWVVDNEALCAATVWTPRIDLATGLRGLEL
jgi:nucleoside-diphosphate-sugar epimerase